jgi:uncharacterized membrane protein YcaP (DUF421 family)
MQLLLIVISTLIVYLFIITAIRFFGKREISQLSVIDLVFILLISNAVQNAMVGGDVTMLIGGLVAAATLFVINNFLGDLFYKSKTISNLLQGEPLMLIYEGKIIEEHMKKAKISMDELEASVREHGVEKISEVNLAVLERDGNISVLSHDFKQRTSRRRKAHKVVGKETA